MVKSTQTKGLSTVDKAALFNVEFIVETGAVFHKGGGAKAWIPKKSAAPFRNTSRFLIISEQVDGNADAILLLKLNDSEKATMLDRVASLRTRAMEILKIEVNHIKRGVEDGTGLQD